MTEKEWLVTDNPCRMIYEHCDRQVWPKDGMGARKMRLCCCAIVRFAWINKIITKSQFFPWLARDGHRSLCLAEDVADGVATLEKKPNRLLLNSDPVDGITRSMRLLGTDADLSIPVNFRSIELANTFRCLLGNPWRKWDFNPLWRTPDVIRLANAIYSYRPEYQPCIRCKDRKRGIFSPQGGYVTCPVCLGRGNLWNGFFDPQSLMELSDALEEAGLDNEEGLKHLRTGCHVRGCYVLDAILDKR